MNSLNSTLLRIAKSRGIVVSLPEGGLPETPRVVSLGANHPLAIRAAAAMAMKEARPLHRPPPFRPLPRRDKP